MLDKQADDIVVLDLRKLTTLADYFVICTGSVDVHVRAIVDHIDNTLRTSKSPLKPRHLEGYTHLNWVLIDYGDIVVHVFKQDARKYYQLEQLWGDAPIERVSDEVPART